LTGGLAHALNNYLAVIIGNLDLLADREHADPEIQKLIEGAVGGALRGAELTRSLLAFSRRQPLDPKVQDIGERIVEVAKLLKRTIGEKIVVELSVSTGLWPVKIDGAQLDSCIVNLANNSRDAMPNGGTLSISVRNVAGGEDDALSSDCVLIELGDTGAGMSSETLAQAFEPFFTTKGPHRGSGLGLSMVHGFVHQSGGVIRIASEPGKGTTMRILLPRAGATDRPKTGVLPRGSERILVVEDNEHVRATAVGQLASLGYGVVGAESGDAALALLRTKSGEFDLVLTDIVMPGRIDGYELAQLVLERWPGKKVLLTSGFADDLAGSQDEKTLGLGMLRKPYRKADLARAIRAALTE
jgi:CheY-like chemotaxis protein